MVPYLILKVHAWARAGFSFIINDGEHGLYEGIANFPLVDASRDSLPGRYGNEQNAMILRLGLTPIQRLHREAISEHGDALMKGTAAR
jgi:hypothetical protein